MSLLGYVLLIMLVLCVSGSGRRGNCGSSWCTCHPQSKLATCKNHGRNLTYIPKLPKYVTNLKFSGNHLSYVSIRTFDNITSLHLLQLSITFCGIQHITPNAFSSLLHLRMLSLNGNLVPSEILAGTFRSLAELPIVKLSLEKMSLRNTTLFKQFFTQTLQTLILKSNKLKVYNHSDFEHIINLRVLSLGYNQISTVSLAHSLSLQRVDLRKNKVSTFPNFCPGAGVYFRNLEALKLDNNLLLSIDSGCIKCLKNLSLFSMNGNHIQHILPNTFSELSSLKNLILRSITFPKIDEYAFNNSKVEYISMTGSHIIFKKGVHKDAFRGCTNIKSVDVSFNVFHQCNDFDLDAYFGHLSSLEGIGLGNCGIRQYPTFIQLRLKRLKYLKLYGNYIHEIPAGAFQPLANLTHLWLTNNIIAKVEKMVFPDDVRKRLEVISLMNNPFFCNCELLWFLRWTKSEPHKFKHYPEKYVCDGPGGMRGKDLSKVNLTEYTCLLPLPVSLTIIVIAGSFLFFLLNLSLIYRWRWHIRYYMHLRKKKRRAFRPIPAADTVYDAYVIYSFGDIKWIKNELIPNLEDESDQKLYIRDRDSLAGIPIVENVVNNMAASRRVLIVLSNAMARDEQCQFELMFVQRQEEHTGPMVLVMLEDVKAVNVTQSVYALVKMNSYMWWSEEREARELFWNRLQLSLRNVEDDHLQLVQNQ